MPTRIFVNLPVKDLPRSMAFFRQLGFDFNPQFTDDTAACMVIDDNIFAMLLTEPKFQSFISTAICDATQANEVLVALSRDSREAVDEMVQQAVAGGGSAHHEPQDYGFMYANAFCDLDGHIWELLWMPEG